MTDFYKYLPTQNETQPKDLLGVGGASEINRAMAETLRCELDLLGAQDPLLVPIGSGAARVLVKSSPESTTSIRTSSIITAELQMTRRTPR